MKRSALAVWLPLALVLASPGGCAGSAFSGSSDAGATGGGGTETGGAATGGSSNATGGRALNPMGGKGGASSGGSAGSAPTGGTGPTGGKASTGGIELTGGKAQTGGGASTGGTQTSRGGGGGGAGTGGNPGSTGGITASAGAAGDPAVGGAPSEPEVPQDGLVLWLAADRGVVQTGGVVSKWQDQSPKHQDASQVLNAARPRRVDAAQNGLPMLDFDGVDDSLALPEGFDDFSKGLSYFGVVNILEDGTCQSVMQLSNGSEIDDIDFGRYQGSLHYEIVSELVTGPMDAFVIDKTSLVDYVHDADGGVELRLDGQFMISGSMMLPAKLPRVANFLGRSLYLDCRALRARVGEILLYNRSLGSQERVQVEEYLSKKWDCCSI